MWKVVFAATLWASVAGAQVGASTSSGATTEETANEASRETSPEDRGQAATEAFHEGSVAADELRWGDAERAFQRAYDLSGLPEALYMRGVALRALDRHVEARDAFQGVVTALEANPALLAQNTDIAAAARNLGAQSQSRIARLDIGALDPAATLQVDGRTVAVVSPRTSVEVDAGAHTVVVERDGYDTFVWTNEAEPGTRVTVDVVMSSLVVEMRAAEIDPRPARRRRALVATIVSLVVVAAVGTAIGVRLAGDVDLVEPQSEVVFEVP